MPDSELEKRIIGSMLLDPGSIERLPATLEEKHFRDRKAKWLYAEILRLQKEKLSINHEILLERLPEKKRSSFRDYICQIADSAVTADNVDYFALKLQEQSVKDAIEQALSDGADPEVLLKLSQELFDLRNPNAQGKFVVKCTELFAADLKDPAPVIAGGILPEGAGLILAGESGEGKSLLRLELAIRLALGRDCWGLRIPTRRHVLIVQFENTLSQERFRLGRMMHGLGIDGATFNEWIAWSDPSIRFDLGLKGDRKRSLDLVSESGADVIIWDPLSSLHSKNENDNIDMRAILDTITAINRQTNSSSIVIDHFGKPGPDNPKIEYRLRGATSKRDWADTYIGVTRKPHAYKIHRLLTFAKIRNGPERPAILLERDDHFLHHVIEEDCLCPPERVREILVEIGGKVSKQADLEEAIITNAGCSDKTARTFIRNATERGFIKPSGEGKKKGYVVWN